MPRLLEEKEEINVKPEVHSRLVRESPMIDRASSAASLDISPVR